MSMAASYEPELNRRILERLNSPNPSKNLDLVLSVLSLAQHEALKKTLRQTLVNMMQQILIQKGNKYLAQAQFIEMLKQILASKQTEKLAPSWGSW